MNACILAGGFGNRLKPLTNNQPKPMLNVANRPMIDYCVSHLKSFGISDIVMTLGFLPEKVIEWCVGYNEIVCHYAIESQPQGTCGSVKATEHLLSDTFIVVSGDALENVDFKKMLAVHKKSKADITMAVTRVGNPSLYGVVQSEKGIVKKFVEKPSTDEFGNQINCGIYIINKSILRLCDKVPFDFARDLFPRVLNVGKIAVYEHKGYWCDIGDISSYYGANFHFMKTQYFAPVNNYNRLYLEGYLSNSSDCSLQVKSAKILGTVKNSVIGANVVINKGANVNNCVVLDNAFITEDISNAVIDRENTIQVPIGANHMPGDKNNFQYSDNYLKI